MWKLNRLLFLVPVLALSSQALADNPPSRTWYYCTNPQGYFPQVDRCVGRWMQGKNALSRLGGTAGGTGVTGGAGAAGAGGGAGAPSTVVYFDFNSAVLTEEGRHALDRAVATFQREHADLIQVTGYTDLSGTESHNLPLSKQRADAIKNYLLNEVGLLSSQVDEDWKGMDNPAVPTPPGAREPKNRRAEIVIQ